MKTAIVTGASSGIGRAISLVLLGRDFQVYGFGRDFTREPLEHPEFHPVACDLADSAKLTACVEAIRAAKPEIHVLVNNAGVGHFGPHETLGPKKIREMVAVNLEAPLILTHLLLRDLRTTQGFVINIASITAKKASPHGCAYAATKAGLAHFGESLFEETRKAGVKVVTICPDMTKTPFFDHLDFREGEPPETYLTPECVAGAVETVLSQREGTVMTEVILRPQRHGITRK